MREGDASRHKRAWNRTLPTTFSCDTRTRTSKMAKIHSFIYGIDANSIIRKVAISREARTTYMTLNPSHGSDAVPVREIVARGQLPWLAAEMVFDLYEAVEIPADL